ncbi:MAG: hypothetical protein ACUVWV_13620 [Thermodesulfobacteriota bacterium]
MGGGWTGPWSHAGIGGGWIDSEHGGWSQVLSLRKKGESGAYNERILGDGDFVQAILKEADQKVARQIRAGREAGLLVKILREKCREAGVNEIELRSGSRRRAVSELRGKLCFISLPRIGYADG